jgi:hypothetical protein
MGDVGNGVRFGCSKMGVPDNFRKTVTNLRAKTGGAGQIG